MLDREPVSTRLRGAGVGMEMMDMGGGQMMAMPPEWTGWLRPVIFVMWAVMMVVAAANVDDKTLLHR